MSENKAQADPVAYILNSEIGPTLSKGLMQLYKSKPQFPVTFLGKWLKSFSDSKKKQQQLISNKPQKQQRYKQLQQLRQNASKQAANKQQEANNQKVKVQQNFHDQIAKTHYMEDLLTQWLPQHFQVNQNLSGSYIGKLRHPRKKLEQHVFDPANQYDTQAPKIIQYIGSSKNHKDLMIGKILAAQNGKSFDVFNIPQDQPVQELAQGQQKGQAREQKPVKKKYIYIADVLKQEKIHYFKFPRLGSFVCYPLKYKNYLLQSSFDKGIIDYKQHLKAKQQIDKQYRQKLNELRSQMQDARKKYEDFQGTQEQASITQKNALKQILNKAQQAYNTEQINPPAPPELVFDSQELCFIVGNDTLGQDRTLSQACLDSMDFKVNFFKSQWENKEKKMLMDDILAFIEEETSLDAQIHLFSEQEKNMVNSIQSSIKQQYPNSQKQQQYQISLAKCQKLIPLLSDQQLSRSRFVYLKYSVPKFREILQIGMMLVGYGKEEINQVQSNNLDWRKVRQQKFIDQFLERLGNYPLARQFSQDSKTAQYKINKLLERCQKIDMQSVGKYNVWVYALATTIKSMCWARIQCRDAKIDSHQRKLKAKQDRQTQITKWQQQIQGALKTHLLQLQEELKQSFNEEQWRKSYISQNPKPEPLQVEEFRPHLDID